MKRAIAGLVPLLLAAPAWADPPPPDDSPRVRPGIDVIAQYVLSVHDDPAGEKAWFHTFDLARAHAWVEGHWLGAEARLVVEGLYSTSEGSLLGVAGDSIVLRLREAYAGYLLFDRLSLRAGVVPTMTIPALEDPWAMRAVAPVGIERVGFASPADLGASARVDLPLYLGWVGVGAYNGEGYNGRELNRGKNTEIVAVVFPFGWLDPESCENAWLAPLGVMISYVGGSSGTGSARANRVTGALFWSEPRFAAGVDAAYAYGIQDDGTKRALLVEGFVRGEPVSPLLLAAQVGQEWRDLDADPHDELLTATVAVGLRVVTPLSVFVAGDAAFPTDQARVELPAIDDYRLRAIARATF